MKHLGAALAVPAAAFVTFLLYKGVPFFVVGVAATLMYTAFFWVSHKRKVKESEPADPSEVNLDSKEAGSKSPQN